MPSTEKVNCVTQLHKMLNVEDIYWLIIDVKRRPMHDINRLTLQWRVQGGVRWWRPLRVLQLESKLLSMHHV